MAYSTKLELMIDAAVKRWTDSQKKKMFGGVCYLLGGNMAFGIYKDSLIVRTGREKGEEYLRDRNVKPFDITGRVMSGWIMVGESGWRKKEALGKWLSIGKRYALSLPEKKAKIRTKRTLRNYRPGC